MKSLIIKLSFALVSLLIALNSFAYNNALRIKITGNGYSDETVVRLLNGATDNFDGAYDAWKMFTPNPSAPSIYTQIAPGQELSINALPEYTFDKSVTIFTNIPVSGTYTLEIEEIFQMTANYKISLTDLSSGNHYYISGDTVLSFTMSAQQNVPTFLFNISTPISLSTNPESCFGSNDGEINIENQGNTNWTYEIIDSYSNIIASNSSAGITVTYGNLAPGTYTVKVSSLGILDEELFTITAAPNLVADFELSSDTVYLSEGGTVDATNHSQNALSFSWDFGSGNNITSVDPSYTYSSIGNYTVTLDAYNNNCMEQASKNIVVLSSPNLSTSVENQPSFTSKIKNFNNGTYQFTYLPIGLKTINVYTLSGKLLLADSFTSSTYDLSLSGYSNGMYIVSILGGDGYSIKQKIIQ